MSRIAQNVLISAIAVTLAFVAGNVSGLYFYPRLLVGVEEDAAHDPNDTGHAVPHEDEHLALTEQAFENLDLRLGKISRGEYWKSITVPGEVTEIPGWSNRSVSAPVSGIVESVSVLEGQAVGPAAGLFTLSITDDGLTEAQSKLLATLSREEVLRKEIARLSPPAESGVLSRNRLREFEYELNQLEASQTTLKQEILGRGLPEAMLVAVLENRSLATSIEVVVPAFLESPTSPTIPVSVVSPSPPREFSVERIQVHPGKTVQRGEELCQLAYHAELYIQGQAFDRDLPALAKISEAGWKVNVEFGHEHDREHSHTLLLQGLELLHVDNHVDRETQTSSFYLPIRNEVVESIADEHGREFQQWRFKPGQRVHVKLPTEHWEDQLLLPLDAVVVEGPEAFVFVEHDDPALDDQNSNDLQDAHDEIFIEFEPVPVRLLHRDDRWAIVADDDQLSLTQRVALNRAYQLHLAMELQSAGGGGHHHHDH